MKKNTILTLIFCVFMSLTCIGQTRKTGTAPKKPATTQKKGTTNQRKTTSSKTQVNDGAEISLKGRIDYLFPGGDAENKIKIAKNIKANYVLKLFKDPSDMTRPVRKTAILTCDIDWKSLGADENVPCDWSWSGKSVEVVIDKDKDGETRYIIMDGNKPVVLVFPNMKNDKGEAFSLIFLYGGGNQLAGLRQGMHIDDVARQVQSEIPGTRVVITGEKVGGLKEYVLLSYGESKVYDVTGDYHYQLNNNEPYFTFWTDSNDKLVKWFALKRIR